MTDVLKKSITNGDLSTVHNGGAMYLLMPQWVSRPAAPGLPAYWSTGRDLALRSSLTMEAKWAGAIYKTITKIASLGWEVADDTDSTVRVARAQDLLAFAHAGQGWVPFIERLVQDFLLTDNGCFIEVVRATKVAGSRILGLVALDSARCTRTGDPDIPVVYRSLDGKEHEVKAHQVLMLSDMPSSGAGFHGVGLCAASRSWPAIIKLAALEQYIYEKASGDGATELAFVHGISTASLEAALVTADAEQRRKGALYYKGKILIPILGDIPPTVANVPLKNVPDGFDIQEERQHCGRVYATNIGMPEQDVQPLSGQGLGTGTQSTVLDDAGSEQGMSAFLKWLGHLLNNEVFPSQTTFSWSNEHDLRDQERQANIKDKRATTRATMITSNQITPAMARQLAVDMDDLPREFIPQDTTAAGRLSDDEKPMTEVAQPALELLSQALNVAPTPQPGQRPAMKAKKLTVEDVLDDDTLARAAALYAEMRGT